MNKQNREQYNYTSIFVAHYLYNERDLVSVMDQGIPPIDYEQKALSVNGCVLADQEQIEQEITRLTSALAYDCDFEYDKYASMNRVTNKLSQQIERPTISIGLLKRIIVHMDFELGVKLSFRNVFHQMRKVFQMEKYCYDNNPDAFSFEWLCNCYESSCNRPLENCCYVYSDESKLPTAEEALQLNREENFND